MNPSTDCLLSRKRLAEFLDFRQTPAFIEAVADYLHRLARAEVIRDKVAAYTRPIFDRHQFRTDALWREEGKRGAAYPHEFIQEPKDLYLAADDEDEHLETYYQELHEAHLAHEFASIIRDRGPGFWCPALIADSEKIEAERHLLEVTGEFFQAPVIDVYGDDRKRLIDLILGLALKDPTD